MKKAVSLVFGLAIIITVLLSGCSTDTTYIPPTKAEPAQTTGIAQQIQAAQSVPEQKPPEQPKVTIFKVGETATDNELKATINGIRFTQVIDEQNNEFIVAKAPEGKVYAIIDLIVENILPDKTQNIAIAIDTSITDQDGYTYSPDVAWVYLAKKFNNQEILPGMKSRGEVAYLVPKDATDLKFIYKFDLFTGTSAVFDIK